MQLGDSARAESEKILSISERAITWVGPPARHQRLPAGIRLPTWQTLQLVASYPTDAIALIDAHLLAQPKRDTP